MSLSDAREAVLRDLRGVHEDLVDTAVEHRRWWVEQWAEGEQYLICLLAQDVQEAVHALDPRWPLCTEASCPEVGAHALTVEPDLGTDPFWVCHTTGLPVAPVGSLP